ncbi:hypothetical protein HRU45_03955 [Candidatus Dependentiae bacterium]|nr:hypothetical protein [Candidatus Dependentiae bacterium]
MNSGKKIAYFSPGRVILTSMFFTILAGTLLLALPIAQKTSTSLLDLLFTATSATCVTGLTTVPLNNFTGFGHSIILILIQIGGLGVITLSLFIMSLFTNLGFTTQLMAGQLLDLDTWKNVSRILLFIITLALIVEIIGALCLFPIFYQYFPLKQAAFMALFQSVASFCNAGISLVGTQTATALFYNNSVMLIITGLLMLCGSLGFIVWIELCNYMNATIKKKRYKFSLLSKIVLSATVLLVIGGAIVIWFLEKNNGFASMGFSQSWIHALFNSITSRSTGFLSLPLQAFTVPCILFIFALAFIGASPGSTGSGVKITTMAIFIATIRAAITGRTSVNIKGRRIPKDLVFKSTAIVALSIFCIFVSIFVLLITEGSQHFWGIAIEATSAFTNLGISTGLTKFLSSPGKLLLITSMIAGRIGSLTLLLALKRPTALKTPQADHINYPEERVMLS